MNKHLRFEPEVKAALDEGQPVVALESTVITHGLPQPANLETALSMQAAVREAGAVPATIAVIRGTIRVGLTTSDLEYLSARPRDQVRKCSRRDLAAILARGEDGATTVAGTLILSKMAGISLFATGGIGGVHRGSAYDVSADLTELGRTPAAVVCSGAKSILDLPTTREVLETLGVPILGYQTDEFPAFFSPTSGLPVDVRVNSAAEAAGIIRSHKAMNLQSALLVTVPAPALTGFSLEDTEDAIDQANKELEQLNIHGAEVTPWLLARVSKLTGGQSLRANVALLVNNARVAAQIAVALSTS